MFIFIFFLFICFLKNDAADYEYLQSKPFKQRLELAQEWVEDCPVIVEVGGGSNPISNYCENKRIIVIDPQISRKDTELVSHIRQNFEHWKGAAELRDKQYALVIMGLDLKMSDRGWNKLFELIDKSKKTIIEYSVTYNSAKQQLKNIKKNIDKKIEKEQEFDLSEYDFKDYNRVFPYRKMILLS